MVSHLMFCGRAMEIVYKRKQLKEFILEAFKVSDKNPILIDKFIDNAMEVDVDALSDGEQVFVAGIMQQSRSWYPFRRFNVVYLRFQSNRL